ncbi:MAG: Curculin protein [uncultured bacterium]|nr:MAG: Curculin protein [uncultured bacterium]
MMPSLDSFSKHKWAALAAFSFILGIGTGQFSFEEPIPVEMASKMGRELQASSFNYFTSFKQGSEQETYEISYLQPEEKPLHKEEPKEGVKEACLQSDVEAEPAVYGAEVVEMKIPESIVPGEAFEVQLTLKNTGNRTWYSNFSGCEGKTFINMGTLKDRDRTSVFYDNSDDSGWISSNRLGLLEDAVSPQEIGTFAFSSVAPVNTSIYREYFGLVAEHVTWFEGFEFPLDLAVGEVTEADREKIPFIKDKSFDTASLSGERLLDITLSTQTIRLKFGEEIVYTTTISSGAPSTPTPTGTFKILNQQELRIGGKSPHYRMPYWQGFTSLGHGLHALPYLGNNQGGVFWSEALNHIGIPVSHGCIRMLPDDAALVYDFGYVGMQLNIHKW